MITLVMGVNKVIKIQLLSHRYTLNATTLHSMCIDVEQNDIKYCPFKHLSQKKI